MDPGFRRDDPVVLIHGFHRFTGLNLGAFSGKTVPHNFAPALAGGKWRA
jgi:hypothetical protein